MIQLFEVYDYDTGEFICMYSERRFTKWTILDFTLAQHQSTKYSSQLRYYIDQELEPHWTNELNRFMVEAPYCRAPHRLVIKAQTTPQIVSAMRLAKMLPTIRECLMAVCDERDLLLFTHPGLLGTEAELFQNVNRGA
jgi:hypothetical protein